MRRNLTLCLVVLSCCLCFAQETEYKNLKVLPKDISKQDLTKIMKGWSSSLGVRCLFCHVGEPGAPLSSFDFESDEKDHKKITRQMVEMTKAINADYLSKVEDGKGSIDCRTCHRGLANPHTLEQAMGRTLNKKGLDEAVKRYDDLRKEYFGGDSYNFGEESLERFATGLAEAGKHDEAIKFLEINLVHYPSASHSHYLLAQSLVAKGDKATAITHLEKAVALDAQHEPAAKLLAELKK